MAKLTDKQEQFCQEYLIDLNGTQAAIRAGYSKNSANDIAAQNLAKPNIQARVAELKAKRNKKVEIDQIYVLKTLKTIIETNRLDFMGLSIEEIKNLPEEIQLTVEGFKTTRTILSDESSEGGEHGGNSKVIQEIIDLKFISKIKALEMINRHIGFYEKDNTQKKTTVEVKNLSDAAINDLLDAIQ